MCAFDISTDRKEVTWIVVADGRKMRVYESRQIQKIVPMGGSSKHFYQIEKTDWELDPVPRMDADAESSKDYQMGHDHRGSLFGFTAAQRHTVEPHIDVRDEIREHLISTVAAKLLEACKAKNFDHLILIAPPQILGKLKELLDPSVTKRIAAEIPKNLTHYKKEVLLGYIKDALPSAHAIPL
jgi:protein required for attachment to host cells